MRHNAEVHIIWDEDEPPLSFYITSYGAPENIRQFLRQALSKQRRDVKQDPERIALCIMARFMRSTDVYIKPRDKYLRTISLNLIASIPRITIKHNTNEIKETAALFTYLGSEKTEPVSLRAKAVPVSTGKHRRGRPNKLRDLFEPLPENIMPDEEYEDDSGQEY